MSIENWIILLILGVAIILFVTEKLRVDLVAMLVLITLILTGILETEEAFSGFSSTAVITVWAVFIISGGLTRSGVADYIARFMLRVAGHHPVRLTATVMLTVGLMSAFMNNIGAVAILLPAVIGAARQAKISPSKLLIPLAFASLMGGNMTMIGTPPNILASNILQQYGDTAPFSFFDFAPMGILILLVGILYMVFIGNRLLPDSAPEGELSDTFLPKDYVTEVRILANSPLIGKSLLESGFGEQYDLNVLFVESREGDTLSSIGDRHFQEGDILIIEGARERILSIQSREGLELVPAQKFARMERGNVEMQEMVEITLSPRSTLVGQSLIDIDFRNRFGSTVMAIRHAGESLVASLAKVPLRFGDSLLVQGARGQVDLLRKSPDFLVLEQPPLSLRRTEKAPIAIIILVGVVAIITIGWLHVSTAMLLGALLMVLTKTLTMNEAYESIQWQSIFLIAGMLPLGLAMEKTGTASLLANGITDLVGGWGPIAVLLGIYLMTSFLTEVMSNAAATVLVVPIAIDAARALGADPRAFVMAIVIAASTSFLMPIGHQANVIVFGPGNYKFFDYTKVGVWLNVLIFLVVLIFLPMFWPLFP